MKIGRHSRCKTPTTALQYAHKCSEGNNSSTAVPMTRKDDPESSLDLCIDDLLAVNDENAGAQTVERRGKPRLKQPFPARVWGVDSGDLPFNVDCVLDNISSTGLYVRVPKLVDAGSEVRLIVHFLSGPTSGVTASLQGRIVRTELQADGRHGFAIAIDKHKFL